jgi:hypothetical protein
MGALVLGSGSNNCNRYKIKTVLKLPVINCVCYWQPHHPTVGESKQCEILLNFLSNTK